MTQLYIKQRLTASVGGIGACGVKCVGASGVLDLAASLLAMLGCK